MPWTKDDYPNSMKNLDARTRNKAIGIANALLREGYEEGRAIPIATKQAEEWSKSHSEDEKSSTTNKSTSSSNTHTAKEGKQHVVPHEGKWAVKKEHSSHISKIFDSRQEAIDRAKEIAKNQDSYVVIHKTDGTIQDTIKS